MHYQSNCVYFKKPWPSYNSLFRDWSVWDWNICFSGLKCLGPEYLGLNCPVTPRFTICRRLYHKITWKGGFQLKRDLDFSMMRKSACSYLCYFGLFLLIKRLFYLISVFCSNHLHKFLKSQVSDRSWYKSDFKRVLFF